ncbi:MAG: hypothetical protein CSA82_03635 [Actinobacteria bacterium]|nr:MAG: hypothetical protein CSA82_03635 [Actinomycetota bacterium]
MVDIDISPQDWGRQSSGLRSTAAQVEQIATATSGTLPGNPFGSCFTPVFSGSYQELVGQLNTFNASLGQLLDSTAQTLDNSAASFIELEDNISQNFMSLLSKLGNGGQ